MTRLLTGTLLAVGLTALAAPPSGAATGTAPVTAADSVTVTQGVTLPVDVLANDSDVDGDTLEVCRLGEVPEGLDVETVGTGSDGYYAYAGRSRARRAPAGDLQLVVTGYKPGTYAVTYYACDLSYLTPATLTVRVEKAPRIKIKVHKIAGRPGQLKVTNKTGVRVRFAWGVYNGDRPDGYLTLGHKAKTFTVRRTSITWIAYSPYTPSFKFGAVRDIQLPRGTQALAPGAPKGKLPGSGNGAADSSRTRAWVTD